MWVALDLDTGEAKTNPYLHLRGRSYSPTEGKHAGHAITIAEPCCLFPDKKLMVKCECGATWGVDGELLLAVVDE